MAGRNRTWDRECDILVVGSGGGALAGALAAVTAGADTMVIEKTDLFGGTTAYSGGGMWIPLNPANRRAGVPDSPSLVQAYLDATVGGERRALRDAYLAAGPGVIASLEESRWLDFEWRPFPDYFGEAPGALEEGRSIYALDFDLAGHEEVDARLRQPLAPEKGGWREAPGKAIGGRAFLARLVVALEDAGARLHTSTCLDSLVVEDGRVIGARAGTDSNGSLGIRARRGVLLASGGFERDPQLRHRHQDGLGAHWTLGAPGNTGGALCAAVDAGAATDLLEECWWSPGLAMPDGTVGFRLFERGKPGGLIVNGAGRRFANESLPYDRFGREMRAGHRGRVSHIPSWFVVDQAHVDRYGFATARAGKPIGEDWYTSGAVVTEATLDDLAEAIGVPAGDLGETVRSFNRAAEKGVDGAFHRGESAFDRFFGDPGHGPNPCLGPLEKRPFHAWKVLLADLGTKGGVRCNGNAQATRPSGDLIPGLYAAGNTMASWTNHAYPGPGAPIGSGVVFATVAVRHMLGEESGAVTSSL